MTSYNLEKGCQALNVLEHQSLVVIIDSDIRKFRIAKTQRFRIRMSRRILIVTLFFCSPNFEETTSKFECQTKNLNIRMQRDMLILNFCFFALRRGSFPCRESIMTTLIVQHTVCVLPTHGRPFYSFTQPSITLPSTGNGRQDSCSLQAGPSNTVGQPRQQCHRFCVDAWIQSHESVR